METKFHFLISFSSIVFFFFFFTIPTQSANLCEPVSCHLIHGPEIRFPFRLANRQPVRCGYPGFDLYCNSRNQTILNLPKSGEFVVDYIDYRTPAIYIDDPGSCLPNRSTSFSLSDSPFRGSYFSNYVFLNCSDDWADHAAAPEYYVPLQCLSGRNSTVLASIDSPEAVVPEKCQKITDVSVPLAWTVPQFYGWPMDLSGDFELVWSEPACGRCEIDGGICGFRGDSGLEVGCSGSRPENPAKGLPRGAKYAIIVGVGIPGLICIIGLSCYSLGMIKTLVRRRQNSHLPTTTAAATFSDQRPIIRSTTGLDRPTIESYPMTVLGESRRLPNPSDRTCPICLCDYEPKETLRSVPECNHYFHVGCIDEWLKLNGTCPLCRNSPEISSANCSSTISLSSSSSTSPDHP